MNWMDNLPTVISCCFCCFLRAGTVMIGVFSFLVGLMFAPNISHTKGFWEMEVILSNYSSATETAIQLTLGVISIMLCICSMLLVVGAICSLPSMILVYQYGALVYSGTVFILFFILAIFCFFVHSNCILAGGLLCMLIFVDVLITAYFILVANSLRVSIMFLRSEAYGTVV